MKAFLNMVKATLIAVIFSTLAVTVHAGGSREQTGSADSAPATAVQTAEAEQLAANIATGSPWALKPKLVEILGKYMVPSQYTWGDEDVSVYNLDPNRFNEFKAELDNGGEYRQVESGTYNRDWEQGQLFARLVVRPNSRLSLELCRADNSVVGYNYTRITSGALGLKLQESLSKYIGPRHENWGDGAYGDDVLVYNLDANRFDEFKAELDASGEYGQTFNHSQRNRDWERGKAFARFVVFNRHFPNVVSFELQLYRSDNSGVQFGYTNTPRVPTRDQKIIRITGDSPDRWNLLYLYAESAGIRNPPNMDLYAGKELEINDPTNSYYVGEWRSSVEWSNSWLGRHTLTLPRWTGTGKYYIVCQGAPRGRSGGGNYAYSEDGINPTPIDIRSDVTELDGSKFIWISDYNAG